MFGVWGPCTNSVGNINTAKSLQNRRKQFGSRRKKYPDLEQGTFLGYIYTFILYKIKKCRALTSLRQLLPWLGKQLFAFQTVQKNIRLFIIIPKTKKGKRLNLKQNISFPFKYKHYDKLSLKSIVLLLCSHKIIIKKGLCRLKVSHNHFICQVNSLILSGL